MPAATSSTGGSRNARHGVTVCHPTPSVRTRMHRAATAMQDTVTTRQNSARHTTASPVTTWSPVGSIMPSDHAKVTELRPVLASAFSFTVMGIVVTSRQTSGATIHTTGWEIIAATRCAIASRATTDSATTNTSSASNRVGVVVRQPLMSSGRAPAHVPIRIAAASRQSHCHWMADRGRAGHPPTIMSVGRSRAADAAPTNPATSAHSMLVSRRETVTSCTRHTPHDHCDLSATMLHRAPTMTSTGAAASMGTIS